MSKEPKPMPKEPKPVPKRPPQGPRGPGAPKRGFDYDIPKKEPRPSGPPEKRVP